MSGWVTPTPQGCPSAGRPGLIPSVSCVRVVCPSALRGVQLLRIVQTPHEVALKAFRSAHSISHLGVLCTQTTHFKHCTT